MKDCKMIGSPPGHCLVNDEQIIRSIHDYTTKSIQFIENTGIKIITEERKLFITKVIVSSSRNVKDITSMFILMNNQGELPIQCVSIDTSKFNDYTGGDIEYGVPKILEITYITDDTRLHDKCIKTNMICENNSSHHCREVSRSGHHPVCCPEPKPVCCPEPKPVCCPEPKPVCCPEPKPVCCLNDYNICECLMCTRKRRRMIRRRMRRPKCNPIVDKCLSNPICCPPVCITKTECTPPPICCPPTCCPPVCCPPIKRSNQLFFPIFPIVPFACYRRCMVNYVLITNNNRLC